jgi:hypothetical protein
MGFVECDAGDFELGYEKIALFTGRYGEFLHVARQESEHSWTSKCAQYEDISHPLEGLEGDYFGKVAQFMKRPLDARRPKPKRRSIRIAT